MATEIHDAAWVKETIDRLAAEIMSDERAGQGLALMGLQTRGVVLAERLGAAIQGQGGEVSIGSLDVTMYRDDLHTGSGLKPIKASEINFDLNGLTVVLVDDVMCTGRTIRAAMDAIFDYGRPACVRLLAMLDRGERELPIQPDFAGDLVSVPPGGFVRLKLKEIDPLGDGVFMVGPGDEEPA